LLLLARPLHDLRKTARIEARAAHERAIDVWLRHKRARVIRLYAAAVLNADFFGGRFIGNFTEHPADEGMRLLRLLGRSGLAGADRLDRLVGDHRFLQFLRA